MSYQPPPHGFRTFLIVWATQSISVFGSALTFFSLTIWLTQVLYPHPEQKVELAFALSWVSLVFALPTVFIAPLAGAWADRHDRKRTMIVTDFASGCLSLVLAALIVTHTLQFWLLLILTLVAAALGAFHAAAFDTSYAMLVPERLLPRANGMMQTIWSLSSILSPAIAAGLIALPALARQGLVPGGLGDWLGQLNDGTPLAITIDAVTFFFASAVLIFLYIPSPSRTDLSADGSKPKKSIWADVKEGALYIWHRRPLLWLLGTFTVANFVGAPIGVFQPLIVKFNLVIDWAARNFTFETALALLSSVFSIGGVVGGLFISTWGGLKARRVYGVLVPMIISGIGQILFGFSSQLYFAAGMVFFVSAMTPILNVHSQAIWQTQVPRELQGRVFSVRRVIAQCTWPLSTALAGWVGGVFNPGMVMAVLGTFLSVFCVTQLFNPYLLHVEDKAYLDEMAAREVAKQAK
ncbi:MFS transporter [Candidatus Acetothermia bacterium]|nr:MFS transporter [Candidatus Acetothermia bacterium]